MRGSLLPHVILFLLALLLFLLPPEWVSAWRLAIHTHTIRWRNQIHLFFPPPTPPLWEKGEEEDAPDPVIPTARREIELRLRQCEAEIASLRTALAMREEARAVHPHLHFLPARVFAYGGGAMGEELTIDRGREDGVAVGDVVLQGQAVVGTIVQVGRSASRLLLLSSPGHVLPARTGHAPREICGVHGKGGGRAIVIFYGVPTRATKGTPLFTTDLLSSIPPDLLIGTLSEDPRPGETPNTLEAPVMLHADWTTLDEVLIVRRIPPSIPSEGP